MKKSARIITIITILISLLGGTLIQSARAESKVIHVKWDAGGSNNGTSWTNAYTDLQLALSAAVDGDEIWVAAGTYKPTTGTDRTVSFALKDGVAIYGGFAGTESLRSQRDFEANITILSGDLNGDDIGFTNNDENSHHVTTGSSTNDTAVLDGFTITGGNANVYPNQWGGGMYNNNGSPSLGNIIFAANSAESLGGGLYNLNSSPQLTNITFTNNTAYDGGGMYNYESSPQLLNAAFDDNIATNSGGAIYNDRYSDAEITDAVFNNNAAGNSGGAILNVESSPILANVLFYENTASHGGGIHNRYESNPTLTNVVFSANTATNKGGGIYNFQSNPVLINVTLSNNTAVNLFGGGMYNETNSNPNLTNVTFSGNSALRGGGMYNHQGSVVQITNATFNNNIAADEGGGINNSLTTSLSITNGTFSGNSSIDEGGAIYNSGTLTIKNGTLSNNSALEGGGIFNLGTLNIVNTIIAKTSAGGDCFSFPAIPMNTKNLVEDGSCSAEFNGDPKLGPLADNGGPTQTMALLPGSPAINAGDDANCPATDQRGVTRPQGSHCDIGAYEYEGPFSTFSDVPFNGFGWAQIEAIYAAGITGGCSTSPLNYCPNQSVTRAQMAVFLLRGIFGSSHTPPSATGTVFADVPSNVFAAAWIEQMVDEGITAGCGGGNFCPNGLVTRAQMAVFLLRAKHGSGYAPPSATGTVFTDVPSNGFAAAWIEQLVAEGITSGCGGGNYCPNQSVTRAQMAVFLQRIFNLPLP